MEHARSGLELPAGFVCDEGLHGQPAEENQYHQAELIAKDDRCDDGEDRENRHHDGKLRLHAVLIIAAPLKRPQTAVSLPA